MTTITLDLPDDLAKQLQKFDAETLIVRLLHQFFSLHSDEPVYTSNSVDDDTDSPVDEKDDGFKFTILPPNPADDDFVLLPPVPLPEFEPPISKEEWKKQLLTVSQWTEEEISEIEKAREYVNQWRPKEFF
jgi:hypothetical protein